LALKFGRKRLKYGYATRCKLKPGDSSHFAAQKKHSPEVLCFLGFLSFYQPKIWPTSTQST